MHTRTIRRRGFQTAVVLVGLALAHAAWAAFGDDIEKPKPEFTRQGERIAARLIPRGKSTSVQILFQVQGGTLLAVEGAEFEPSGQAGIDTKDFRSDMFTLRVGGLPVGGEATVSLASAYFTGATELWTFNRAQPTPWVNTAAANLDRPDRVQELVVTLRDGGPLDADGTANGEILLVAGPRDSFWGYALGTLLIRFFGIFLVLGVLMVGMIAAGLTFQRLERRRRAPKTAAAAAPLPEPMLEDVPPVIGPDAAAAIGLALHLHLSLLRTEGNITLERSDGSSWARQGRSQLMRDRLLVHDRAGRK
jgi:hypothetical protein